MHTVQPCRRAVSSETYILVTNHVWHIATCHMHTCTPRRQPKWSPALGPARCNAAATGTPRSRFRYAGRSWTVGGRGPALPPLAGLPSAQKSSRCCSALCAGPVLCYIALRGMCTPAGLVGRLHPHPHHPHARARARPLIKRLWTRTPAAAAPAPAGCATSGTSCWPASIGSPAASPRCPPARPSAGCAHKKQAGTHAHQHHSARGATAAAGERHAVCARHNN